MLKIKLKKHSVWRIDTHRGAFVLFFFVTMLQDVLRSLESISQSHIEWSHMYITLYLLACCIDFRCWSVHFNKYT